MHSFWLRRIHCFHTRDLKQNRNIVKPHDLESQTKFAVGSLHRDNINGEMKQLRKDAGTWAWGRDRGKDTVTETGRQTETEPEAGKKAGRQSVASSHSKLL